MPVSTTEKVVCCSFCGKPQGDVRKLVAGPGVYICDGCVGLCVDVMTIDGSKLPRHTIPPHALAQGDEPIELPSLAQLSDDELAYRMLQVNRSRDQIDDAVGEIVRALRQRGWTWARIGETLGMTRQSAWERYSGEE